MDKRTGRFSGFLLAASRSPFTVATAFLWTFLSALLASPVLQAQATQTPANKITLEDLVSLHFLGEPVLSPDGTQFAFVRGGQIELLAADGGWPVVLTTSPGKKAAR